MPLTNKEMQSLADAFGKVLNERLAPIEKQLDEVVQKVYGDESERLLKSIYERVSDAE